jgi:uncharacterized alpha-E superfamily protein
MANPLGSGVLECPALLPFLPALAKAWLGEDLLLPNVASWWCGQEKERKYVLSHLPRLVIKRVDRAGDIVFGEQLSSQALQQLGDAISAEPWRYVGQERVSFSTVPTLAGSGLAPRHMVLRSFLAGDGEHYDVLPGALCRVAGAAENLAVSAQAGGWSKDTWLLRRSGSMRDVLRLHPAGQRRVAAAVLTSRAAENLFWAASYLERSESLLRLAMAYQKRYETWLDYGFDADLRVLRQWLPLLQLYLPGTLPGDAPPAAEPLRRALFGGTVGSLVHNLQRGLEAVYTVRDLWPLDSWRVVEALEQLLAACQGPAGESSRAGIDRLVQPLLNALLAFWGAGQESLSITQGGLWLHIGRRLERVQNMLLMGSHLCRQLANDEDEALVLETLLTAHGCVISHRRRYGIELNYLTVWQHLLLEVTNPRSLLHQLEELESLLHYLNASPQLGLSVQQKILLSVVAPVRLADAHAWSQADTSREALAPFLTDLSGRLRQLEADLDHHYFRHTQAPTQFAR